MQPKFCSKCGKPLKEGDNFCRKCGAKIRIIGTAAKAEPVNTPLYDDQKGMPVHDDSSRKANITLSSEEMLTGCNKILDFGTGKKYEVIVPGGLLPGDIIRVKDTGIVDPDTGKNCDIELKCIPGPSDIRV